MSYNLTVRIEVIGRASRRWRGARSPAEADRLNQALSEQRAQNLRKPVEEILRKELPGVKIEAPAKGLGSHHGFPLTGEDNAAIDRSVVVSVDLITTIKGTRTEFRPRKIYAPSKFWTLRVVSMVSASGGAKIVHIRSGQAPSRADTRIAAGRSCSKLSRTRSICRRHSVSVSMSAGARELTSRIPSA